MEVGAESGCDREKGRVCGRAEFSILDTKRGEEGSGTPGGSPLPPLSLHLGPPPFWKALPPFRAALSPQVTVPHAILLWKCPHSLDKRFADFLGIAQPN